MIAGEGDVDPMSSQWRTPSRMSRYCGVCWGLQLHTDADGTISRGHGVHRRSRRRSACGEYPAQQVDQRPGLVALDGVPGVLDEVLLPEICCAAGGFGGVLIGHNWRRAARTRVTGRSRRRRRSTGRRSRGRRGWRRNATPSCVVEAPRVVEHSTAQRFDLVVRCRGDGQVQHGLEAGELALALNQRHRACCSVVSAAYRCSANGMTSTNTSSRTSSGAIAPTRIPVNPPSDMPTRRSASGASSRNTGASASALCRGE